MFKKVFIKGLRRRCTAIYSISLISILLSLPVITGPQPPVLDSPSYVLLDPDSGRVIYGRDIHAVRAPASTTKMMTALLASEMGNPDDIVTISYNADREGGSSLGITEGEQIPLGDLTFAMMVRSGNDSAVAIAEHIAGSVDSFCELMNQRADELGMVDTNFVNPNGLPDEDHYSTAFDLALLASEILKHDDIMSYVDQTSIEFPVFGDREDVIFENTNHLLEDYPLCNGIKTGFTNLAGFCVVASAAYREKTLIAVVLGCGRDEQWGQAEKLFDYGFTMFDPDYDALRALYRDESVF